MPAGPSRRVRTASAAGEAPRSSSSPHPAARKRPLVLRQLEVHQSAHRPFGRPRIRSATMFRWICEVPAAIVYEREDSRSSDHAWSRSSASGAEHLGRRVVQLLARLRVAQLEDRAADARARPPAPLAPRSRSTG